MKNTHSTYLLLLLAVVLTFPTACTNGSSEGDANTKLATLRNQKTQIEAEIAALEKELGSTSTKAPKIRTVGIQTLSPNLFKHFIDMQGRVDAENIVMATAKMPGSLTRVLVKNGSQVTKGQLIAEIDNEVMLKGLGQLESQLAFAKDVYDRQKGLWDQKIGTEVQYLQAKNAVESIEKQIATTKEQAAMSKIYAPMSGTVDGVMLKVGQSIAPGMPLCQIVNLGDLKIKGEVSDAYVAKIKNGDAVQLYFPDLNKEMNSRVTYISKTINPVNRTFTIECSIPTREQLKPNMIAVLKVVDYSNPSAIVVPVNIIQRSEKEEFVLTIEKTGDKSGVVKKATITQGANYNGMVEIKTGLNKNDVIITTGFQDVNVGETVNF